MKIPSFFVRLQSNREPQKRVLRAMVCCFASLFAGSPFAFAANGTWTTGNGSWATDTNWASLIVPGATGGTTNADTATFGSGGSGGTITVDEGRNIGSIVFGTNNYTLDGGKLVLSAGGSVSGSSGSLKIYSNVALQGNITFNGSGTGGGIWVDGDLSGNAAAASSYVLSLGGTATTNKISGIISDGIAGGSLSLTKTGGAAVWELSAANTYTGGTTISAASGGSRLLVTNGAALGTGNVSIGSGSSAGNYGQLQLSGGIALDIGASNKITVASGAAHGVTATSGHIVNVSGNNSYAGDVESGGHLYLASQSGKLLLSGNVYSTYGGGTAGTSRTLSLSGEGDGEIAGQIYNTNSTRGWFAITKAGNGTWTISNQGNGTSRNTYKGATSVNAGTLLINADNTLATGAVTVNNGGTFGGNGIVGGVTSIASGGSLAPGASQGTASVFTFASELTLESGSSFQWDLLANTESGRGTSYDGINFVNSTSILSIQSGVTADLAFNSSGSSVVWADAFWNSSHEWLVFSTFTGGGIASVNVFDTISVSLDSAGATLGGGAFSFKEEQDVFGNSNIYLVYNAIPEPVTVVLVTIGFAVAFARYRRWD